MIRANDPNSCRRCIRWGLACSHASSEQPDSKKMALQIVKDASNRVMTSINADSDSSDSDQSTSSTSDSDSDAPANHSRREHRSERNLQAEVRKFTRQNEKMTRTLEKTRRGVDRMARKFKKLERTVAALVRKQGF
jgi:hypothetical protein